MDSRLGLRQTQSQRLALTPQLQLAIRLLQLSALELRAQIDQELLDNPLLEELPQAEPAPDDLAPAADAPAADSRDEQSRDTEILPFDLEALFDDRDVPAERERAEPNERQAERPELRTDSLIEHLERQLRIRVREVDVLAAALALTGLLDDDGYLRMDLAEAAAALGLEPGLAARALEAVQALDPRGVGARDLRECLLLQIHDDPAPDPLAVEILESHFEAFVQQRTAELVRKLGRSDERVREALAELQRLEPKPGRPFGGTEAQPVVPDVSIERAGGRWVVILNDENVPRLRVHAGYRQLLREGDLEARRYVKERVGAAVWLIRSIEQRQRTLRRVAESIVKFQSGFLEGGIARLRPLALRDVADDIGMHESTVSRVTTSKYAETPQGLFSLKFFFQGGLATVAGDRQSTVVVKDRLRRLLSGETGPPLADGEIARRLRAEGLVIARRTVAKYREELGIPASHQRRGARPEA